MDKSLELIHCDLKKITYLYRYQNSNKCVFIRKSYKNLHQIWKIYSSKECYYVEENVDTEMKVLPMGNNDTASPWVWALPFLSWDNLYLVHSLFSLKTRIRHSKVQWGGPMSHQQAHLLINNHVKWGKQKYFAAKYGIGKQVILWPFYWLQ